jgi:predicted Fe-S protein YdhL (DUF1289 family)
LGPTTIFPAFETKETYLSAIASPCILVCSMDSKTGFCFGCGRTRDEIGSWMNYTNHERAEIMDGLAARLENVERKPRRETRRQKIARERGELPNQPSRFTAGE